MKTKSIKELLEKIEEKQREEIEKTIDACMRSICCEKVDWRNFFVYPSTEDFILNVCIGLTMEYFLPIAEAKRDNPKRKVSIIYIKSEENDYQILRANANELYAMIYISPEKAEYISSKAEKNKIKH